MKIKTFFTVISIISAIFWLSRCTNSQPKDTALSAEEQKVFIEKGQAIAAATFAELSGKLTAAIEEKGIAGAMEYCNLVALPLVDSLSQVHNATIRRTSLKVRNLKDEPQNWEQEILTDFEKTLAFSNLLLLTFCLFFCINTNFPIPFPFFILST